MISLPSITEVKQQLIKTAQRFPLPTLFAVLTMVVSITLIHDLFDNQTEDFVVKALLVCLLGLAGFTGITLASEHRSNLTRNLMMLAGASLLAFYFWILPVEIDNHEGSLWIMRHVFLCLAAIVALFWAPYWQTKVENRVLWQWSSKLIGTAIVTVFFALVLFLGCAAALWAIDSLFGLDIDGEIYGDVWVLAAALFSPLFWLSQFPKEPLKLKAPSKIPAFMSVFTKYIMSPLALGYLVILYAYTAKILITWEWPKNVLGWLVIAFLGVAIFTYFLWTPLLKPTFEKYRRIFWLILIPQIFLLFVAIGWRIHAYSWTENRYFVVVLGLWLLGTTLYFLIRKDAKFKWIFVALTSVILVSQIGPLSGYNMGKKAQTDRLMVLLEEVEVKQGDQFEKINFEANTESENQIASILDYLKERHGEAVLKQIFVDLDYEKVPYYQLSERIMEHYGLNYRSKWERNNNRNRTEYRNFNADMTQPLEIKGYDWKINPLTHFIQGKKPNINQFHFVVKRAETPARIEVFYQEQLLETINLESKFRSLVEARERIDRENLDPESVAVKHDSDYYSAKIYLTNGWRSSDKDFGFSAEMYIRFKDKKPSLNPSIESAR